MAGWLVLALAPRTRDPRPTPRANPELIPLTRRWGAAPHSLFGVGPHYKFLHREPSPPLLRGAGAKFSLSTGITFLAVSSRSLASVICLILICLFLCWGAWRG